MRSASGESLAILLYAPRSLNENTGCRSSRFSKIVFWKRAERLGARSRGVSSATSYTRAVRMRLKYSFSMASLPSIVRFQCRMQAAIVITRACVRKKRARIMERG